MTKTFQKLGIDPQILQTIEKQGFKAPTPIQEKAIPLILKGNDVIAGSSTGSGKTLAFSCGFIQDARPGQGVQALVLCPTRELAAQVAQNVKLFSRGKKVRACSVYGGVSIHSQIKDLERAELVIGTPGRILDHLERQTLDLSNLQTLVLDEADTMLDMGFVKDVEKIMRQSPSERQTLFFTATLNEDVNKLARKHMTNPSKIVITPQVNPALLEQIFYEVAPRTKISTLMQLLKKKHKGRVMVFCNTKKMCDLIGKQLREGGVPAKEIHGNLHQNKRNKIMKRFHNNEFEIMVCTDVAARGLHIPDVAQVFNFDIPKDPKQYVHRIGRTARAGASGQAISIITKRDVSSFNQLLRVNKFTATKQRIEISEDHAPRSREKWQKMFDDSKRDRHERSERKPRRFSREHNDFHGRDDSRGFGHSRDSDRGSRGGFGRSRDGDRGSRGGFGRSRDSDRGSRGGFGRSRDGGGSSRGGFGRSRDGGGSSRGGSGRSRENNSRSGTSKFFGNKRDGPRRSDSKSSGPRRNGSAGRGSSRSNSRSSRGKSSGAVRKSFSKKRR